MSHVTSKRSTAPSNAPSVNPTSVIHRAAIQGNADVDWTSGGYSKVCSHELECSGEFYTDHDGQTLEVLWFRTQPLDPNGYLQVHFKEDFSDDPRAMAVKSFSQGLNVAMSFWSRTGVFPEVVTPAFEGWTCVSTGQIKLTPLDAGSAVDDHLAVQWDYLNEASNRPDLERYSYHIQCLLKHADRSRRVGQRLKIEDEGYIAEPHDCVQAQVVIPQGRLGLSSSQSDSVTVLSMPTAAFTPQSSQSGSPERKIDLLDYHTETNKSEMNLNGDKGKEDPV